MNILIGLLTAVHVIVALFLIVLVLMQKSNEQGVGAAFGGGMTETMFGAGTTTALVRMTIWCAGIMLASTLLLAVLNAHSHTSRPMSATEKALQAPAPAPVENPGMPNSGMPSIVPPPSSAAPAAPANPAADVKPSAPEAPAPAPSDAKKP